MMVNIPVDLIISCAVKTFLLHFAKPILPILLVLTMQPSHYTLKSLLLHLILINAYLIPPHTPISLRVCLRNVYYAGALTKHLSLFTFLLTIKRRATPFHFISRMKMLMPLINR
ncbi:hypothetical protein DUNSADRAFT_1657 [Dunaliella salina]|uniref:Uncharacterized protein n=1 Tax=Dunaliella salina TaxID=3046 RepID=A0ABQ7FX74_DUNSA|nr:hypothetical protein DUNSADRAFT_1657 [Dunaliella salina]|eukprot:KAF5826965.1 hypothetical protein DUNSADRAFT_1657 [Dunaliella salina]